MRRLSSLVLSKASLVVRLVGGILRGAPLFGFYVMYVFGAVDFRLFLL
uniref:Uncharacterized protein n=1 Tax=Myoviridae sp. ctPkm1 TaxID=2825099 RepID=A0A8S5TYB7_9CAUD|nr:MAG TPA: hypothetical protein [Myoviridae sp. ctPkm1]